MDITIQNNISDTEYEKIFIDYLKNNNDIDFQIAIDTLVSQLRNKWKTVWEKDQQIILQNILSIVTCFEETTDIIKIAGLLCIKFERAEYFKKCFNSFGNIIRLPENIGGSTAFLSIPGYLIHNMYSLWGSYAIHENQLDILKYLLESQMLYYPYGGEPDSDYVFQIKEIFHPDFFGHDATKAVGNYLETHKNKPWIHKYFNNPDEDLIDYIAQLNWIICMKIVYLLQEKQSRKMLFWADFGRFYEKRLKSLLIKLKNDVNFGNMFCKKIFNTDLNAFWISFNSNMKFITSNFWRSGSGYLYHSISTKEELE
jgi:hypothetical protein